MGARQKLNEANVFGAIVIAGILGFASGSWIVFAVASAVFIGIAHLNGDIRYKRRRYRSQRR